MDKANYIKLRLQLAYDLISNEIVSIESDTSNPDYGLEELTKAASEIYDVLVYLNDKTIS